MDTTQKVEYITEDFVRKKIMIDQFWRILFKVNKILKKTIKICLMTTVMASLYWTYQGKLTKDDWTTVIKLGNDGKRMAFLLNKGFKKKEIKVILHGFFVNDKNLEQVIYSFTFEYKEKDIKNIKSVTDEITLLNDQIARYFFDIEQGTEPKFSRNDILNKIITLKGELELLNKKYNIDTREAKLSVLELERAYKTFK